MYAPPTPQPSRPMGPARPRRRNAVILIAAIAVLIVVAGGVVGYVVWRNSNTMTSAHAGTITPAAESPVLLRVVNMHGSPIVVSGYAGDQPRVLMDGQSAEVRGIDVPTPWHTVITDAATRVVLYDKQLPAGAEARLVVGGTSAGQIPLDNRDADR